MAEKQTNKDRMREIVDSIENGIKELFESDKYRKYLATMSRFHRYSVNNTMLIYMQRPDATHVAGFNKWRDQFGRNVLKGEKGIRIIAPTPYKKKVEEIKTDPETNAPVLDADGKAIIEEKEIRIPMFKVVSVFDVSQTVDNDKYIHVQRSDTGIDYTIYDAGSAKVLDGGVLDGTEQQLSTAALEVCKLHNIGGAAPIRLAPLELLKDLQEANELPLGAGEQITSTVVVPTDAADNMLPELEQAVPMPDPTLTVDDMRSYGYLDSDMLPLSKDRAVELLEHDITVYMLYPDNAEEMVFEAEDIIKHDGMFGVTRPDWDAVKGHIPPRDVEQRFLNSPTDAMAIYQLRRDAPVELRFANLGSLAAPPDPANYEAVYTREVYPDDDTGRILENFYYIFNDERPGDFVGHSLSVSDIVALKQDGKVSYHYCDSMGFQELPAFQKPENYLKAAEMSMEDDYGMIDGIINNGPKQPTVADLEAQVKAGMSISLMDLAEAAHREKKKSVLEQLKSQPAQERPHKTAPKKSAEKEL